MQDLNDDYDLEQEKGFKYEINYINNKEFGFLNKISTLTQVLVKMLYFPRRELNPGLLGESQLS